MRWPSGAAVTLLFLVAAASVQRGSRRFSSSTDNNVAEEEITPRSHRFQTRHRETNEVAKSAIRADFPSRDAEVVQPTRSSARASYRSRNEVSSRDSTSQKEVPIESSGAVEYERLQSAEPTRKIIAARPTASVRAIEDSHRSSTRNQISNSHRRNPISQETLKRPNSRERNNFPSRGESDGRTKTVTGLQEETSPRSSYRSGSTRGGVRISSQTEIESPKNSETYRPTSRGRDDHRRPPDAETSTDLTGLVRNQDASRSSPRSQEVRGRTGGRSLQLEDDDNRGNVRSRVRSSSRGSADTIGRQTFKSRGSNAVSQTDEQETYRGSSRTPGRLTGRTESDSRGRAGLKSRAKYEDKPTEPITPSAPLRDEPPEDQPKFEEAHFASTAPPPEREIRTASPNSRGSAKGNSRGRGTARASSSDLRAGGLKEKVTDEVSDSDNYPEVYKQLKKSGTDPKDILALLKAKKAAREAQQKLNLPHLSPIPEPTQSNVNDNLPSSTVDSPPVLAGSRNFRKNLSRRISERTGSESAGDVTENGPKNGARTGGPTRASPVFRSRSRSIETPIEHDSRDTDNGRSGFIPTARRGVGRSFTKATSPPATEEVTTEPARESRYSIRPYSSVNKFRNRFAHKIDETHDEEAPTRSPNPQKPLSQRIETGLPTEDPIVEITSRISPVDRKRNFPTRLDLISRSGSRQIQFRPGSRNFKDTKDAEVLDEENSVNQPSPESFEEDREDPLDRPRTGSNLEDHLELKTRFQQSPIVGGPDRPKYVPRNRLKDKEKFRARTETSGGEETEPTPIKPRYHLYDRENDGTKKKFAVPTIDITTASDNYKSKHNLYRDGKERPSFALPRKVYTRPTSTSLPLSKYKERKEVLSRSFGYTTRPRPDDLDEEEGDEYDDPLRRGFNGLAIDSLVSESETITVTTEPVAKGTSKRPRKKYGESHVFRIPPRKRPGVPESSTMTTPFVFPTTEFLASLVQLTAETTPRPLEDRTNFLAPLAQLNAETTPQTVENKIEDNNDEEVEDNETTDGIVTSTTTNKPTTEATTRKPTQKPQPKPSAHPKTTKATTTPTTVSTTQTDLKEETPSTASLKILTSSDPTTTSMAETTTEELVVTTTKATTIKPTTKATTRKPTQRPKPKLKPSPKPKTTKATTVHTTTLGSTTLSTTDMPVAVEAPLFTSEKVSSSTDPTFLATLVTTTEEITTPSTTKPTTKKPTQKPKPKTTRKPKTTKATTIRPTTPSTTTVSTTPLPSTEESHPNNTQNTLSSPNPTPSTSTTRKPTQKPKPKTTQKPKMTKATTVKPTTAPPSNASTQMPNSDELPSTTMPNVLTSTNPTTTRKPTQKPKPKTTRKPKATMTTVRLTTPSTTTMSSDELSRIEEAPSITTPKILTNPPVVVTYGSGLSSEVQAPSTSPMPETTTTTTTPSTTETPRVVTILSTLAQLANNLTAQTTTPQYGNTAKIMTYTQDSTPAPSLQNSTNFVVYGLLPNNDLVRKVVRTTPTPVDVPFIIYGLYPNGTIVRRYPNGTVVPEETEATENEVIANIEPGNKEVLEEVVRKDSPLAYLYPPNMMTSTEPPMVTTRTTHIQRITTAPTVPVSTTTTEKVADIITRNIVAANKTTPSTTTISATTENIQSTTTVPAVPVSMSEKPVLTTTTEKVVVITTRNTVAAKVTTPITTTIAATTEKPENGTERTTKKFGAGSPTTALPGTMKTTSKKPAKKGSTVKVRTEPGTTSKPTTTKAPKTTTKKPGTKGTTKTPSNQGASTRKPTANDRTTKKPAGKSATTTKTTVPTSTTVKEPVTNSAATSTSTTEASTTVRSLNVTMTGSTRADLKSTTPTTTTKVTPKPSSATTKTTKRPSKSKPKAKPKSTQKPKPKVTTTKAPASSLSDVELLNNLLKSEKIVDSKAPVADSEETLANKVIQLAIERATQKGNHTLTTVPMVLSSTTATTPQNLTTESVMVVTPDVSLPDTATTNNATGKISLWVIDDDNTTTIPVKSSTVDVDNPDVAVINALLSTPGIDQLSVRDQLILADVLSSTAFPQTTEKKKKKKPKTTTTTTTTTTPPPAFPLLRALFGRSRWAQGRGLFGAGGGAGLTGGYNTFREQNQNFGGDGAESVATGSSSPSPAAFDDDTSGVSFGSGQELTNVPPETQRGLVGAAINVSRAVSQFMGFVIQGATQSFQNYLQSRTSALANALANGPIS